MVYAVIDTNVFVSAYLTHNLASSTSKVVDLMFRGIIRPLYNEEINLYFFTHIWKKNPIRFYLGLSR